MAKKKQKPSEPKVGKSTVVGRVFRGQILSSEFFRRHWLAVVITVVVALVYITTKYVSQTNMEKIDSLNEQLTIVKNEMSRERSTFMGRTRETGIRQLVDSLVPGLEVQQRPPYKLTAQ